MINKRKNSRIHIAKLERSREKIKEMGAKAAARITMGLIMALAAVTPCFADITDAGQNFGSWIQEQALYIALAVVAVVMVGFIIKKAWIPAAMFIIVGAVLIAIVSSPDQLATFGQSLLTRFTK